MILLQLLVYNWSPVVENPYHAIQQLVSQVVKIKLVL